MGCAVWNDCLYNDFPTCYDRRPGSWYPFLLAVSRLQLWVHRVKKLKLDPYSLAAEEYEVCTKVVSNTIEHIEENLSLLNSELLNNIKTKYEIKFNRLQKTDCRQIIFQAKHRRLKIFSTSFR